MPYSGMYVFMMLQNREGNHRKVAEVKFDKTSLRNLGAWEQWLVIKAKEDRLKSEQKALEVLLQIFLPSVAVSLIWDEIYLCVCLCLCLCFLCIFFAISMPCLFRVMYHIMFETGSIPTKS